ncbi:hypothetical protein QQ045_004504 [Rhodiola kirilowii]
MDTVKLQTFGFSCRLLFVVLLLHFHSGQCGELQYDYYSETCPKVEKIIKEQVVKIHETIGTTAESWLRILFHDCMVKSCDASLLLKTVGNITSELEADRSFGIRNLKYLEQIKNAVERECPETVSCADIMAIAARDAIVLRGGPMIKMKTGRRDSTESYLDDVDTLIPDINASTTFVLSRFKSISLDVEETVAILGKGQLQLNYYSKTCPRAEEIIKNELVTIRDKIGTVAESFLRYLFHDCMVKGCDASLLLKSNGIKSEQAAELSFGLRNFRYLEAIKEAIEHECPSTVSCADVLALAARDSIAVKVKRVKKMDTLGSDVIKMPKVFTYKDLKAATKCFDSSRIIGHGAFGVVYRGVMPESGDIVAVKRCSHNSQGKNEFLSELSIIGSLRHRNLVRLQGWCHEKGEILLVYDLMPNGSLDKALFEARTPLPWYHRQRILMGVASALAYLHQECENQVIHRDVKTSNIMLDEGFRARLGDFGLARQVEHDKSPEATVAAGTMGYLAPEYLLTGRASEKTDVFSYGAVVLEVASGRRPIEKETSGARKVGAGGNLVEWVWSLHRDGKLLTAADDKLRGEFDEAEMRKVLLVGLICSHPDPSARPTMRAVVQMLAGEAEVPIVPRTRPSLTFSTSHLLLSLQDSVSDCNGIISLSSYSSENSYIGGDELV